ncbi:MAG: urtB, partial [Belnapia sp.]|nr:urtB [Belnapia sp.]
MNKLISGFLLVLLLALPARAQDAFTAALPGLAGGFGEAATAVEQLGASADPRALPVLRAMADGRLQKTAEGGLRVPHGDGFVDPATGQPASAEGAEAVRLNNRVRQALRGALGQLQIISPDAGERLAAAEGV